MVHCFYFWGQIRKQLNSTLSSLAVTYILFLAEKRKKKVYWCGLEGKGTKAVGKWRRFHEIFILLFQMMETFPYNMQNIPEEERSISFCRFPFIYNVSTKREILYYGSFAVQEVKNHFFPVQKKNGFGQRSGNLSVWEKTDQEFAFGVEGGVGIPFV